MFFYCYSFYYLSFRTERSVVKNLVSIHVYVIEILRVALDDNYSLLMLTTGFSLAIFQVFTITTPTIMSKVTKAVMMK